MFVDLGLACGIHLLMVVLYLHFLDVTT